MSRWDATSPSIPAAKPKTDGKIVIKRVMPRQNEQVNEIWICDKGRFAYHYMESEDRLTKPLIAKDGKLGKASWKSALDLASEKLTDYKKNLVVLASGRLSNEDLFNLKSFADLAGGKAILYTDMGGGELTTRVGVGQGFDLGKLGARAMPSWWLLPICMKKRPSGGCASSRPPSAARRSSSPTRARRNWTNTRSSSSAIRMAMKSRRWKI